MPSLYLRDERYNMQSMKALLEPGSIAVVGASTTEGKSGYFFLRNLIDNGYRGGIYPINPNVNEIFGYKTYRTILEVPHQIDLAFILIPRQYVKEVLSHCAEKSVKSAAIVAAGFGEVGDDGLKAQKDLEDLIKKSGIRCIGPNTIGFVNMQKDLVASFVHFQDWMSGPVAIGAQSGIFAGALATELMQMKTQRFGICKSVSFGNMIDLDETDFLDYCWEDSNCEVVAFYLERIKRPRAFLSLANKVKRDKPIIVLKSGRTEYGAKAALSHTGSLATNDNLVEFSFRQYGVIRTVTLQEFLSVVRAFSYQPLPLGNRVGVITFSDATGVMASDEIYQLGLKLADFTPQTLTRIGNLMPEWQPVCNPVDLWAALGISGNRKVYEESIRAVLNDENVDVVLCILIGLSMGDIDNIRDVFESAISLQPQKPIFLVIIGGKVKERWINELEGLSLPIYSDTSLAVKAIEAMHFYHNIKNNETLNPCWDNSRS